MGAAEPPRTRLYTFCRYAAAVVLSVYGFAKLNGSQFTVLDSELAKPMGEVSGFWLTWYYFGYSPFFGALIGLGQVALAVLLAFRRTALLAACAGVALLTTIVLLNVSYGIALDAMLVALAADGMLAYVVWRHADQLRAVLMPARNPVYADGPGKPPARRAVKLAGVVLLVVVPAGCTYWIANYNNRAPTPVDGVWAVASGTYRPPDTAQPLDSIYFEYNRAHMVVFRFGDQWRTHHFEVGAGDGAGSGSVRMWEEWLRRGEELFTGTYQLDGDRLTLRGTFRGDAETTELVLERGQP